MNRYALLRYQSGLSLVDAAQRAGIGRTTLSRIENGHIERPSAIVSKKLADLYGVSIEELLGLDPNQAAA